MSKSPRYSDAVIIVMVEIDIPFSDPIAEGEVIQAGSVRALKAGARLDGIFDMVASVKDKMRIQGLYLVTAVAGAGRQVSSGGGIFVICHHYPPRNLPVTGIPLL